MHFSELHHGDFSLFIPISRSVQPDPKPIPGPAGPTGPEGPRGPAGEDGRDGRDVSVTFCF